MQPTLTRADLPGSRLCSCQKTLGPRNEEATQHRGMGLLGWSVTRKVEEQRLLADRTESEQGSAGTQGRKERRLSRRRAAPSCLAMGWFYGGRGGGSLDKTPRGAGTTSKRLQT